MDDLEELYFKWLKEKNKGHYKNSIELKDSVISLFGNQNLILNEIEKYCNIYGKKFGGNVLDVGCSLGGMLYSLYNSNKFRFVAGVDIDITAVNMAKKYQSIKNIPEDKLFIEVAQINNMPFEDNLFDFIIMKDVGEHLETKYHLELALVELKRIIKDDGLIFVETPNYLFPFEAHLEIFILPYFATKSNTKILAKLNGKDSSFIDHLNFTTPGMLEDIFLDLNFSFYNVYEEIKIPSVLNNYKNLSKRFSFMGSIFKFINKVHLNRFIAWFLRTTKFYPTLQYVIQKNKT